MTRATKLDTLNEVLAAVQAHLFARNFGVRACVPLPGPHQPLLCWDRHEGKWMLIIEERGSKPWTRPLTECSVEYKRLAAHHLGDLAVNLSIAYVASSREIDEAIAAARKFLESSARGEGMPKP